MALYASLFFIFPKNYVETYNQIIWLLKGKILSHSNFSFAHVYTVCLRVAQF